MLVRIILFSQILIYFDPNSIENHQTCINKLKQTDPRQQRPHWRKSSPGLCLGNQLRHRCGTAGTLASPDTTEAAPSFHHIPAFAHTLPGMIYMYVCIYVYVLTYLYTCIYISYAHTYILGKQMQWRKAAPLALASQQCKAKPPQKINRRVGTRPMPCHGIATLGLWVPQGLAICKNIAKPQAAAAAHRNQNLQWLAAGSSAQAR